MQYFFYLLLAPFLYLNYKIIFSDLKYKIIPNKYLGFLLLLIPFYYIYLIFNLYEINYLSFIGQVVLTFIISFILYSFGIWSAGDAKYLLVLALFIPNIGIIPFIGNIALLTLIYLLGYFIWFYFGKCIFYKGYTKSLWGNIKQDLNEKWLTYKQNKGGKTFFIILKWLVIFLLIFISIRLTRIYLFNEIFSGDNNRFQLLGLFIEKYNIYLIFLFIGIFIGGLYLFRLLINKLKYYIGIKLNINLVGNIFLIILFILLISFITIEIFINPSEIIKSLYLIFTLYISLWIILKIFIYSYKITFQLGEQSYINIKDLKKGEILDKDYLIKMFGNQVCLGAHGINQNKKGILYPNPKKYFEQLKNPIDNIDCKKIKKIYKTVNIYHKNNDSGFIDNNTIKILKTFSFGGYIFIGFIITYLFSNDFFRYIINIGINFIKQIYN